MTTNNEAFEVWFSNKLAECRANNDMDMHRNLSRYVGFYKFGFEAATTEANKRMAELESEVELQRSLNKKIYLSFLELQASNKDLREALEKCKPLARYGLVGTKDTEQAEFQKYIDTALQATPAESLQAHDNEVLERAAKVAMDMPSKADEIHEYRASDDSKAMAWDIYHAIRALKEVK